MSLILTSLSGSFRSRIPKTETYVKRTMVMSPKGYEDGAAPHVPKGDLLQLQRKWHPCLVG